MYLCQVNNVSTLSHVTPHDRIEEQLCLFAQCCSEIKLHQAGVGLKIHLNTLKSGIDKSFPSETAETSHTSMVDENLHTGFLGIFLSILTTVKITANYVRCQSIKLPVEVLKDYLTFRKFPDF